MSRHNRGGLGPASVFDEDSPFNQGSRRSNGSTRGSRPTSPRLANNRPPNGNGHGTSRKNEVFAYDLDADGADDERTPLMGTVRTPRSARASRIATNARLRNLERAERSRSYWIKRIAGCSVMFLMIAAVVLGAVAFFFVTTKPLRDVDVDEIRNVLASEQEIMLDIVVEAVNPNLLTINVADMDVNIFAKSKYVGSEKWWRDHGKPPPPAGDETPDPDKKIIISPESSSFTERRKHESQPGIVDAERADFDIDWPDPDDDDFFPDHPLADPQMMLLGRVLKFDNALTFEGSPIKQHLHYSVGEFRVPHPGNKTEAGGTERWERVLQHPFKLIVRGVLKYNLPLSAHTIAAPIDASVEVKPNEGIGKSGHVVLGEFKSNIPRIGGEGEEFGKHHDNDKIPKEPNDATMLVRSARFRGPAV